MVLFLLDMDYLLYEMSVQRGDAHTTLARTLRSTNVVESMIEICRDHSTNVKRWESGTMALRWCAAGMFEAKKQFRRVNGHLHLRALRAALDEHAGVTVTPPAYTDKKEAAA
jgi:putative transposase